MTGAPLPDVSSPDVESLDCLRNRVAVRLANAVLKLATPSYRTLIKGSIAYCFIAAERDSAEEDRRAAGEE